MTKKDASKVEKGYVVEIVSPQGRTLESYSLMGWTQEKALEQAAAESGYSWNAENTVRVYARTIVDEEVYVLNG